jgi:hypothetical protein
MLQQSCQKIYRTVYQNIMILFRIESVRFMNENRQLYVRKRTFDCILADYRNTDMV